MIHEATEGTENLAPVPAELKSSRRAGARFLTGREQVARFEQRIGLLRAKVATRHTENVFIVVPEVNDDLARDSVRFSVRNWLSPAAPAVTGRTGVGTTLRLLRESGQVALPLVENGNLLGLVFEKDLLRLAPSEATTLDVYELRAVLDRLTVGRVLRPIAALPPGASLDEALLHMGRESLEAVPVADGDCFLGLLTWPSLLAALGGALATA
jgi:CBS domain-containing protein